MVGRGTLAVRGLRELQRALRLADPALRKEIRERYRKVGRLVQEDASRRFDEYDPKTAAGFRTYVRQRGVQVEQSLRKTTGLRPDWGSLQMREGLLPATEAKGEEIVREFERAIDDVADLIEYG